MKNMNISCIENCLHCHKTCFQTAMTHCLNLGGKHIEPEHFRLMIHCAKICETSANFQLSDSKFIAEICKLCEEICVACAKSCEEIGNMDQCVEACRTCADSCRTMAA
jgi:hypothetical protein